MKIASKQSNVCIKSNVPRFKYHFKESGVPVEVEESHVEKILLNVDFYESDKPIPEKTLPAKEIPNEKSWEQELIDIKGIGKKTAEDIITVFPTRGELLEGLNKGVDLPFDSDVDELLREVFIH